MNTARIQTFVNDVSAQLNHHTQLSQQKAQLQGYLLLAERLKDAAQQAEIASHLTKTASQLSALEALICERTQTSNVEDAKDYMESLGAKITLFGKIRANEYGVKATHEMRAAIGEFTDAPAERAASEAEITKAVAQSEAAFGVVDAAVPVTSNVLATAQALPAGLTLL